MLKKCGTLFLTIYKTLNMKKIIVMLSIILIGLHSQAQKKVPIAVPPPPPGLPTPPPPPGTKFVVVKPGHRVAHPSHHRSYTKNGHYYYYKNGKYHKRKKH